MEIRLKRRRLLGSEQQIPIVLPICLYGVLWLLLMLGIKSKPPFTNNMISASTSFPNSYLASLAYQNLQSLRVSKQILATRFNLVTSLRIWFGCSKSKRKRYFLNWCKPYIFIVVWFVSSIWSNVFQSTLKSGINHMEIRRGTYTCFLFLYSPSQKSFQILGHFLGTFLCIFYYCWTSFTFILQSGKLTKWSIDKVPARWPNQHVGEQWKLAQGHGSILKVSLNTVIREIRVIWRLQLATLHLVMYEHCVIRLDAPPPPNQSPIVLFIWLF